ncbi:MAG: HAMP domain-containing histidine kinase [Clostridia bacterium]|nr:HAMP domain-containing histidine kinase [Clostridia bacterium]
MSKKKKDELTEQKKRSRVSMAFVFSAAVFGILLIALVLAAGVVMLIQALYGMDFVIDTWLLLLIMVGISAVMGYGFSLLLGSTVLLKPINTLVDGMNKLAEGDFSARLNLKGILLDITTFREITTSFNRMAEELGNTEMLRTDFVNNFSHEFKTPIVSIAGFAELLRSENLSDEEREHYLGIISEESRRLASLATNILNLTKIENQSILTDVSTYNLSEQIRSVVLLLESKWATKGVVPVLEFDEFDIRANEQLMKEVWLNLLDNAIKYSPECSEIEVRIRRKGRLTEVDISNTGGEIPEELHEKIFMKFYQADESHSGEGSGVGLAVVKRVVELHSGKVSVVSRDGKTTFTVSIP